jgi:Na+/H+ antiporter NhaC
MGILTPLVIPLTWAVMQSRGLAGAEHMHLLYSSVAGILAGSVWGDHCSPISDTTILSSMASGCNHIEHVRTQLPYALLVGGVALGAGSLPVAFGMPWWVGLLAGVVLLFAALRLFGRDARARRE